MMQTMDRDESQIRAIQAPANSSSLVVAPPGYGKTYVMSRRIAHLVRSRALEPPKRLLGLTFTNAAAAEMRNRISRHIPQRKLGNIDLTTIHSFCYQVLVAYGSQIAVGRDFTVISETESESLVYSVGEEFDLDLRAAYGERYKSYRQWVIERYLKVNVSYRDPASDSIFAQIYERYTELCSVDNKLDYDQILVSAYSLFVERPSILEIYRSTYDYVLVDEFQDTNPLQFEFLALLIEGNSRLENRRNCIPVYFFGDRDQAIYQFLGATPGNVEKGVLRFSCNEYRLEKNHRTESPKILELSSALRTDIQTLPSTHPTSLIVNPDVNSEAENIIVQVEDISSSVPLHRICIIAPNHYRLQQVQDALLKTDDIPYIFIPDYSGKSIETQVPEVFVALRSLTSTSHTTLAKVVNQTARTLDEGRLELLNLMANMARDYDYRFHDVHVAVRARDFLNHLILEVNWGQLVRDNVRDKVYVSTIHGVKGLEFDHVIICGLENYVIPHSSICYPCRYGRNRSSFVDAISEAERVLYVGVTRSIDDISLYAARKTSNGKQRLVTCLLCSLTGQIHTDARLEFAMCGYRSL